MKIFSPSVSLWALVSLATPFYALSKPQHGDEDEVEKILSALTLEQKINQMAQIDVGMLYSDGLDHGKLEYFFGEKGYGSLLLDGGHFDATYLSQMAEQINKVTKEYNMPPVILGIDSVHGAAIIENATIFPQQINIASTFNPENARTAGRVEARDTLAGGVQWAYSPILGLGMQPLWPRMFETFGEDPLLVGKLASSMVQGIQENKKSAASAKHFIGYSAPRTGLDRSAPWIPTRHLYQYFVRPWREVIDNAKPLTVMESYSEYDGVPNVAYRNSLNLLLRKDLGFDGVLVTDYHEIENLFGFHHTAADNNEAVEMVITEGSVDISMLPFNTDSWYYGMGASLDHSKEVTKKRIDASVRRILRLKQQLGMLDKNWGGVDHDLLNQIGNPEDRESALKMARDSIILTKNSYGSILPIPTEKKDVKGIKVHVTGPTSDSLVYQSGGWTYAWQGADSNDQFTYGETVLDAVKSVDGWDVTSSCGGFDISGNECSDDTDLVNKQANESDYIIICIGERNYAEKAGDVNDLNLDKSQGDIVRRMKENSSAKIIVVYFGGRPRLLGNIADDSDAFLLAFLPGPAAGRAVVDLVSGKENFVGKLPITYPKNPDLSGVPYWHAITEACNRRAGYCDIEWPFGHGLSYSSFLYSDMKADAEKLVYSLPWTNSTASDGVLNISVNVKNTGVRTGTETVLFFLFLQSRHVTPEHKLLIHFDQVELKPGEEKPVSFAMTPGMLKYIGPHDDRHDVLQMNQRFRIGVRPDTDCHFVVGTCSEELSLVLSDDDDIYEPACESACATLNEYDCLDPQDLSQKECYEKCLSSPSDVSLDVKGWGWNYVNCIESILWDNDRPEESKCPAVRSICRDVLAPDDSDDDVIPMNQDPRAHYGLPDVAVPVLWGVLCLVAVLLLCPLKRVFLALTCCWKTSPSVRATTEESSPLLKSDVAVMQISS